MLVTFIDCWLCKHSLNVGGELNVKLDGKKVLCRYSRLTNPSNSLKLIASESAEEEVESLPIEDVFH